ncbi:SDR family NAD(P)-dependent oxidoreductase [Streptomyces sp. NPDC086519]|uniref:SDR family NAD(P)-dependent oxidoreductase n=1 Tax=Streptomyces sp. NPDC086519 TaxID=3154863 RepID=UPI0034318405
MIPKEHACGQCFPALRPTEGLGHARLEGRIPDQTGRTAVVTGANSGLGYVTARELARWGPGSWSPAGARCAAADGLVAEVPQAHAESLRLDLGDLTSVREFADRLPYDRVDPPVNNAGVMMHALANIDPSDLNGSRRYRRWVAYARSKTANLNFTHELARRLAVPGTGVVAVAAHPGYAATNLLTARSRAEGRRVAKRLVELGNRIVAQPAEAGALPTLSEATAPDVRPDAFLGPSFAMWRGAPAPPRRAPWTLSDQMGSGSGRSPNA